MLNDAWRLELEPLSDERGFFSRVYCTKEFAKRGMRSSYVQMNTSQSLKKGTIRGFHLQKGPHEEAKLIRCIAGEIYDVIIDMRPESSTYRQWEGFHLTAENRQLIYCPPGFAHAYLSLTDNCEIFYLVSEFYAPGAEHGIRYNDPAFSVRWPIPIDVVSAKDATWPYHVEPNSRRDDALDFGHKVLEMEGL